MDSEQTLQQLQSEFGTAQFQQKWVAQDWVYWDMVGYPAAGTNQLQYFTVPAGGIDPNLSVPKKREQTNLTTQNQIGGAECFIATHLRCFLLNSAKARQLGVGVAADASFSARQLQFARFANSLTKQGVLTWTILQKKMLIQAQPWQLFPAGFGLGEVVPPAIGGLTPINGGANAYTNTSPFDIDGGQRGDTFTLAQPMFLAPNTTFSIDITFPLGNSPAATNIYGASTDQTATVWTGVVLQGWKVRPRQ